MSGGGAVGAMGAAISGILELIGNSLAWDARSREIQRDMAMADENAAIAAEGSADAIRRGNIEAAKLRIRGTRALGEQAAAYQGGGVDATTGTPADMAAATEAVAGMDAQQVANDAAREAWGMRKQSQRFKQQRSALREKHEAEQTSYSLNQTGVVVKTALNTGSSAMKGG